MGDFFFKTMFVLRNFFTANLLKGLGGGAFSAIPRCLKRECVRKREREMAKLFFSAAMY